MSFFQKVYEIVRLIPRGKVATYGQVAMLAGNPRMSRQVGWALHSNPCPGEIPCHRVIMKDGSLTKGFAFGGADVQKALLVNEGVEVSDDFKVDIKKFLWDTKEAKDYEKGF